MIFLNINYLEKCAVSIQLYYIILYYMIVSFLLPTRKRYDWLVESIESIIKNANEFNFDILLAMDTDDDSTISLVKQYIISSNLENIVKIFTFERKHYHNLHLYVNELAKISNADYLCLWNDDAQILTKNWDVILNDYIKNQDKLYVYQFPNNHCPDIFPIVPKQWIEITGHFSNNAHNDTWIQHIAIPLNVNKEIPIHVNHYKARGEFNDLYNESILSAQISSPDFFAEQCQNEIKADVIKLREKLYFTC